MSAIKKLQGGTDSELTRLKGLWRGLEESAREFWRAQFIGPATQAATRQLLKSRLQLSLASDNQLNRFRAWLADEDARQKQADKMEANESMIMAAHPEWTPDQVRAEVIRAAYMETLASGNFKLGLAVVKQDLNVQKVTLDRAKFEFNAAQACLKYAPQIKAISASKSLSETEKIDQIRLKLFGELAE